MAHEGVGTKWQRDQLRRTMQQQRRTFEQIAEAMARKFGDRPRQAWRHAHGWSQDEVASRYNELLDSGRAPMSGKRISDYENWPVGGIKPKPDTLRILAMIYETTAVKLVDRRKTG